MAEGEQPEPSSSLGADLFCPACGYSLYAAPGDKCPECGHSLANLRDPQSRIPWVHRRKSGDRYLAYWRTVWMVTFRPLRFWEEYAKIVRLRDARLFQLITVLHAYLPVLAATVFCYATTPFEPEVGNPMQQRMTRGFATPGPTLIDRAYAEVWPVAVLYVSFVLFLLVATRVPSEFFRAPSVAPQRKDSAVAMSLYACAPLAFYPLLMVVACILVPLVSLDEWGLASVLAIKYWPGVGLFVSPGACAVAWWWGLLRLVRRTMPLRTRRHAAVGIGLPFVWLGLAVLCLGVLPLLVLYVLIVVVSLSA